MTKKEIVECYLMFLSSNLLINVIANGKTLIKKYKLKKQQRNFKLIFTNKKLVERTLLNNKLKETDEKSYMYSKLKYYRNEALKCDIDNMEYYNKMVDEFADLYNDLSYLDSDGIEARLKSMLKEDYQNGK